RRLPLSDELLTALREHRVRTGRREGLIFATRDGGPISPRNLQRHFKAIVSRAELPGNLRLHDLRVTAVTRWREAGTDLEVAAALAGHSTPQVTAGTYSKATEERMRLAIERMG
ncbi:MAG TPA: tyrosine-type recombinase/integrase, partial [Roseiflexaceae bacterium]|nr:tyrosine-type recombinase/integrase [Roseiflexaceae bacterium]